MRKAIIAVFLGWVASVVTGATLTPVQLLNPAGSTAGQAIVSTGPATAPGWGTVAAGSLSPVAANTVIGNVTGALASPTAISLPSCSLPSGALQYSGGTGFSCGTGYAKLASPTFTGTVTASALTTTGAFTPSATAGIVGTTTGNNANAGSIGEYVTATGSNVALANITPTNITSISLTAGDWDVSGSIAFVPAASTTVTQVVGGVSTASATLPAFQFCWNLQSTALITGAVQSGVLPTQRLSLASTTTIYIVAQSSFGVSTMAATATLRARRVR